jgi:NADPH2:quinone reductase
MVSYGAASGPTPEFSAMELAKRGSLFFTRAGGGDYLADAKARAKGTRELFALLKARKIRVHIGQRYPLADAVRAHQDLESRKTSGSSLLIP